MFDTLKTRLAVLLNRDDEEEETEGELPDEPELWITQVRRGEGWPEVEANEA